jgi:hypothetical protein
VTGEPGRASDPKEACAVQHPGSSAGEVLHVTVLAPGGASAISQPWDEALQRTYRELKFVQVDDFVRAEVLTDAATRAASAAKAYATRVVKPHEIRTGYLNGGSRFDRIDWGPHEGRIHDEAARRSIRGAFDASGLSSFVDRLLVEIKPWIEFVVGRRLLYDRTFLLLYGESDFIGPHGDTQTSRRVMVQMPVNLNCRGALRVLRDGWMEPYYDEPGCLRLLGPGIWHDVLPVLALDRARAAQRVLVSARLPYAGPEG